MAVLRKRLEVKIETEAKKEKKKALENLASLQIKLPSWEKLEKEIEKGYEDK